MTPLLQLGSNKVNFKTQWGEIGSTMLTLSATQYIYIYYSVSHSRPQDRLEVLYVFIFSTGARIFVGESEEYKASIAAQKEAQELAALQKEQQSLLGQTSNPSIRASPTVARPREQPQAQQPHNFAQWPTTAHSAAPPLKQQAAGPPGEAQQSMAAISNVAQQVDELETKVSLPVQKCSNCLVREHLRRHRSSSPPLF